MRLRRVFIIAMACLAVFVAGCEGEGRVDGDGGGVKVEETE